MSKCSERTRNAIENDEDVKVISQIKFKDSFWIVKDFRARKMIRAEIMDLVTDYLFTFYGGFGIPSKIFLAMITKWYLYSFHFYFSTLRAFSMKEFQLYLAQFCMLGKFMFT